jgi:hypothetical protein
MNRAWVLVVLAGALLIAVGAVTDWSGVSYSSHLDRGVCLAAAITAAALGSLAARRGPSWLPLLLLVPAALALNMAVVNILDIRDHRFEYADYPDASVGVGLYLVGAGGLLVAVAAATGFVDRRRRRP